MSANMIYETFSSSSSSSRWNYDVFLSFYGEDTRKNFVDHLFTALKQDGIRTFRDDEELQKGDNISSKLMDAIQGSRIAIVVFSQNYAFSGWCLSELVKIMECQKKDQILVLPVFHKVDPSDVRHQKNTFADAFVQHKEQKKDTGKMESWEAALTDAANLVGWDQLNVANGHEGGLIKIIVEKVSTIVKKTHFHVAKYPVGLDSHIECISRLLNDGLDVVRFIGIYGLPGIGKTTIAKAVFNEMFLKFEGSSFLPNVREDSRKQNGLALLQKKLLSGALKKKEEDIQIDQEDRGIIVIKQSLQFKRVLIVLDDVDEMKQLDKLVGEHDWFGSGSRIIITSRDEHLLNKLEMLKYKVETMDENESLQLFSLHAFGQNHPLKDYVQLSNDVLRYARGLPLALVILGSFLCDKRSLPEWENELEKLRDIPNHDIFKILKISYNALDDLEQTIFLDISCFFIGEHKCKVITILDACGLYPKAGIERLIQRSLVTLGKNNELWMHDLIQDMGIEIVRKQSPLKLGQRSRLWQHTDVQEVLRNSTGTDAVEGLQLDMSMTAGNGFSLTTNTFSKMPNLRLLRISCPKFKEYSGIKWKVCDENRDSFFKNLVWVCWESFPFEYIPNNFDLGNLVLLEMPHSKLKEVWKGSKHLPKLKRLTLGHSINLTCTPVFSGVPKLGILDLHGCDGLVKVHQSIGHLTELVDLDLSFCSKLKNLPIGIGKLTSLEILDISCCYQLGKLPCTLGKLCSLKTLDLGGNCSLRWLPCLGHLSKLETLILWGCTSIKSLPHLPSGLRYLNAENCQSLESLPNMSHLKHLSMMNLSLCKNLYEIEAGSDRLEFLEYIKLNGCDNLKSFFMQKMFQVISLEFKNCCYVCDMYVPGPKIRDRHRYRFEPLSASCQFAIPDMEIQLVIICILCVPFALENPVAVEVHSQSKNYTWKHTADESVFKSFEDPIWVIRIPHSQWKTIAAEGGDIINVSVKTACAGIEIGVRLSYTLNGKVSYFLSSEPRGGVLLAHDDSWSDSEEQGRSSDTCLGFPWLWL